MELLKHTIYNVQYAPFTTMIDNRNSDNLVRSVSIPTSEVYWWCLLSTLKIALRTIDFVIFLIFILGSLFIIWRADVLAIL